MLKFVLSRPSFLNNQSKSFAILPSKSQVRKAGKRIAEALDVNDIDASEINIIDDWGKSHLTPLTSIAMWLRKPSIDATGLAPAQRLKRRETVLDKLIRRT
ncbi:hypothetical protein [Xanthomonas fragariae]|uniref:hypothetical protein n=1 Tax=Xanthomonas fragariae TaxID=48664 RepID=UPI00131F05BF|nr:hypothetical protein [Xanthomonas fragariae]MDM7554646.1 hypothetical protein [Xanthomonas fragariae]MDM7557755.1 hypothetical protein [Xanthomonas fragariae]MDM7575425.1 hypothetical protein [Xanthomonas fragariae]MDM7578551.1 hypothetical protein [Xanthomonas fragariae]MDM7588725.1 hypothetical protein [Xanthomonas fragariae]